MRILDISTKKHPNAYSLVDDEDYEKLNQQKWSCRAIANSELRYGGGRMGHKSVLLHRVIMGDPPGTVDHIDGNGLNNQKSNLRVCTLKQNLQNRRLSKNNHSGYKGVCWDKDAKLWRAQINTPSEKGGYIGLFFCLIKAAKAYDKAAKKLYGEFARVNFK